MTISYRLVRPAPQQVHTLNPAQSQVADHRQGELLVMGGARTGKTTALIHAGVSSLERGVPQVLFIASSRRARKEDQSWVGQFYPHLVSRFRVTTFYSLCLSVVKIDDPHPPSLLSAARQDSYVRQILAGQDDQEWPQEFAQVRRTVPFASNLREILAACQRAGLSPDDVRQLGIDQSRDDWVCMGDFYQEYLDILGLASVVDYPELLLRAAALLTREDILTAVRPQGSMILLDDSHNVDSAQEEIFSALTDFSTAVIITANPDSAVFGFRGARLPGLGSDASTICLQQGYGVAEAVEEACANLKRRIELPLGVPVESLEKYRCLIPDRTGGVEKILCPDRGAEAAFAAQSLRRAHLLEKIPYENMAILVRSGAEFSRFAQACQLEGVPVTISGDEIQLKSEEIVTLLLDGLASGGHFESVSEALWDLWKSSGWEELLVAQIERGGVEALRAHRSLDAVVALFALASSFSDMSTAAGVTALIESVQSQEVPEDLPRSSAWASSAVRLTTAHRAGSGCWSLVIVAGVEDGVWPATGAVHPLLSVSGLVDLDVDRSQRLNAERKLFYTGCSSTTDRLVVTAVDDEEHSPSVFFDQLKADIGIFDAQAPSSVMSRAHLIGKLKQVLVDEGAHPGLRQAAGDRLAAMSHKYPSAHPDNWWAVGPHQEAETISAISASGIEDLLTCPRRWFLTKRAAAERRNQAEAEFGTLIHTICQDFDQSLDVMLESLESRWGELEFSPAWKSLPQLEQARGCLIRFDERRRRSDRETVFCEVGVEFLADLQAGSLRLRGRLDRVERDENERFWVVDLKTGKTAPTAREGANHIQMGVYQLALASGAIEELGPCEVAGAELVYLRLDAKGLPKVVVQPSLDAMPYLDTDPGLPVLTGELGDEVGDQYQHETWVHHRIAAAGAILRRGEFPALASSSCRGCSFRAVCPAKKVSS
ncbi:MAG: ATP-dependent helicase [Propionibacteriaceae bacterium]|nr:ATP-dependent helicase [Propionibacteriaceae bacterium]